MTIQKFPLPNRISLQWLLVIIVVTLAIYAVGIDGQYYQDDLIYVFSDPEEILSTSIFELRAANGFYRPIQTLFLAYLQTTVGWNTVPIHLLQLTLHVVVVFLVFRFMIRQDFTRLQAYIGSGFMLVAQGNVNALASSDTLSQVGGVFFGYLTLWFLYLLLFERQKEMPFRQTMTHPLYIVSVATFTISLFMKESSASFIMMVGLLLWIKHAANRKLFPAFLRAALQTLPFLFLFLIYFGIWLYATHSGEFDTRYGWQFGLNIPTNIGLFIFAGIAPISTVDTFVAMENHNFRVLIPVLLVTAILGLTVLYGLYLSRRWRLVGILLMFAFISYLPMIFLRQVSELYVYGTVPLVAVMVGIGLGELIQRQRISH